MVLSGLDETGAHRVFARDAGLVEMTPQHPAATAQIPQIPLLEGGVQRMFSPFSREGARRTVVASEPPGADLQTCYEVRRLMALDTTRAPARNTPICRPPKSDDWTPIAPSRVRNSAIGGAP